MNTKTLAEKFLEKATFKSVVEIDYGDLDDLITEHFTAEVPPYKKGFEPHDIVCINEWSNDSQHSFNVKKIRGDKGIIKAAKQADWPEYRTDELLNQMCFDGIIPECELVVSICW